MKPYLLTHIPHCTKQILPNRYTHWIKPKNRSQNRYAASKQSVINEHQQGQKQSSTLLKQPNKPLALSHTLSLALSWLYMVLVRPSLAPLSSQRPEKEEERRKRKCVCVCVWWHLPPQSSQTPSFHCMLSLISLALFSPLSLQPFLCFSPSLISTFYILFIFTFTSNMSMAIV